MGRSTRVPAELAQRNRMFPIDRCDFSSIKFLLLTYHRGHPFLSQYYDTRFRRAVLSVTGLDKTLVSLTYFR